jgi:hypothetical protein
MLFSYFNKLRWHITVYKYFLGKEKSYQSQEVPLRDKIWLWQNGFNSFSKRQDGVTRSNSHLYLDTLRYKKYHRRYNGLFHKAIDNKALLPFLLPKNLIPEDYCIFKNGKFIGSNVEIEGPVEDYLNKKVDEKPFIYKPVYSSLGIGIIELNQENFNRVLGFAKAKNRTFIISEKVQNQTYSAKFFNGSTNTIRFHLMRDPVTHKLFIYDTIHKIGTQKSTPVDNWSKGGCYFHIDKESGKIGSGLLKTDDNKIKVISHHPDTGIQITGIQIPGWKHKVNNLLNELNKHIWLRYTGIDAVLTEQGFKILELNSLPDLDGLQAKKPIFSDPQAAAFFENAGVYPKQKRESVKFFSFFG